MAVIELTKDSFVDAVTRNDIVIVDFWAPWCGPAPSRGAAVAAGCGRGAW